MACQSAEHTLMEVVQVVSALAAVGGLFYVGRQFSLNAKATRQLMYVGWLEKYQRLKELIVEHPEIAEIYASNILPSDLTSRQEHYIYSVIAFCEAIYQTDQVKSFPKEVPGASWENYIVRQIGTPTIKGVWEDQTAVPKESDYTKEFIEWANAKI